MDTFTKKEQTVLKQGKISYVMSVIMHLLEDSSLRESKLWPKNGFAAGSYPSINKNGNYKMDTINIKLFANHDTDLGSIRFNIWAKNYRRGYKLYYALLLLFDQTINDKVLFYCAYSDLYHKMLSHHHNDGSVMGMLDFKFTIQ